MVGILISVADATGERAASEVDAGAVPTSVTFGNSFANVAIESRYAFISVTRVAAGEPASPLGSDRSA